MLGTPMHTSRPQPGPRLRLLAGGLVVGGFLAALALSGCVPVGQQSAADEADGCGASASCDEPAQLDAQVQLDTDAMLAGIAHARARLGLQEDATP
jgi:hypothetical protein